jgi:hypothetical protein
MFRALILSAAAAGLFAGLLTAGYQLAVVTPLILEAEIYEAGLHHHDHAQIVGDLGEIHALLREQVRQRVEAPHHVETLTRIGDHRGLGLDVLERLREDLMKKPGSLGAGQP